MKDSKKYSKKLRDFYLASKKKYPKIEKVFYDEPLDAIVYAIISEHNSVSDSDAAISRIKDHFIDINDLRVSLAEEVVGAMDIGTSPQHRQTAFKVTKILRFVFKKYNIVSLESLKKMGKRPAKQLLEKLDGITPFVVDYCMLTSLSGHAVPVTQRMVEFLKSNKLVHPEADDPDISGFLARQISANKGYEFYCVLRAESESAAKKAKTTVKVKTKKAVKDKKAKKKVKKKKVKK